VAVLLAATDEAAVTVYSVDCGDDCGVSQLGLTTLGAAAAARC
jgi:hypothetical protein